MGDFSSTKKLPKNYFMLISLDILKNHKDETVYGILIKDSYFSILPVSEVLEASVLL